MAFEIGNKVASDGKFILSTLLAFCHLNDTIICIGFAVCGQKYKTLAPFWVCDALVVQNNNLNSFLVTIKK